MNEKLAKLSKKRQRFCMEYVVDQNATQAAIRAGYAPKSAQEQGSQLLSILMVKEAVEELLEEIQRKNDITVKRVIKKYSYFAFEKEEIRDSDALHALDMLGKYLGMFTEKIEANVTDSSKLDEVKECFRAMGQKERLEWLRKKTMK